MLTKPEPIPRYVLGYAKKTYRVHRCVVKNGNLLGETFDSKEKRFVWRFLGKLQDIKDQAKNQRAMNTKKRKLSC